MSASSSDDINPVVIGSCPFGPLPVKILTSLTGSTSAETIQSIQRTEQSAVDVLEWRMDYLETLTFQNVLSTAIELRSHTSKPLLGTLRTKQEGGLADISNEEYHSLTSHIAASSMMDAIDVEFMRGGSEELIATAHANKTPVVLSYHNFEETPTKKDLLDLFRAMYATKADIVKVALMPQTPDDVLRLMQCTLQMRRKYKKPLVTMSMGQLGALTRVSGALFGSCATFAAVQAASAPGQLPIDQVVSMLDALSPT